MLTPKWIALLVTFLAHLPFLMMALQLPTYPRAKSLPAVEVGIAMGHALEVALLKVKETHLEWTLQSVDLPPFAEIPVFPPFAYTSRVLVDLKKGKIVWKKGCPALDELFEQIRFVPEEEGGYRYGYLTTAPKTPE